MGGSRGRKKYSLKKVQKVAPTLHTLTTHISGQIVVGVMMTYMKSVRELTKKIMM